MAFNLHQSILVFAFFMVIDLSSQEFCPGPLGYSVKNLTKANYWQFDLTNLTDACIDDNSAGICHFFMAFCKPLNPDGDCDGSSVCQYNNNQNITELGHYDGNDPFIGNAANGFYAIFNKVKPIINKYTNQACNLSVNIEFECNRNVPWIEDPDQQGSPAPVPTSYQSYTKDNCEISMKFDYAGACFRIIPVTTTPTVPPPTRLCIPPSPAYNITVLKSALYWTFQINSGCKTADNTTDKCTLYMAFCRPLELVDCEGSSACIRYPGNKLSSLSVGNFSVNPFTSKEVDGFFAKLNSGATIINPISKKECTLSIQMEFICDKLDIWNYEDTTKPGIGPVPNSFTSITEKSCELLVVVPYSGACAIKPESNSLSAGTILLIFFFVVLVSYLIVGVSYNKLVDHQSGWQLIPNYSFWSKLAILAMEGFITLWRFVTCQKSSSQYESIKD